MVTNRANTDKSEFLNRARRRNKSKQSWDCLPKNTAPSPGPTNQELKCPRREDWQSGTIDRVGSRSLAVRFRNTSSVSGTCVCIMCVSRRFLFSRYYLHQLGLVLEARGSKSRASSGTVCRHLCHVSTAQTTMASLFPLLRPRRQIPRRRERYISFPQRSFPAYGIATCLRC